MPSLTWESKSSPQPQTAVLGRDSIIYPQGKGYPFDQPESGLILGDNLAAMSALIPQVEGKIQLIYADPPFFTNRRYPARVGRGEDSRRPQEWQLAEGYPDHWSDLDAYLDMLYPRLALMYRLLAPTGSLYLHLDWHANAYARLLLDEIFGPERLLNELIWIYHGPSPIRRAFNRKHDTILVYTKSERYTFNVDAVRTPYDPNTVKTFESSPKAGFGKIPDLKRGKVPEDWWYYPVVARLHSERTGYPTQKPEALLERVILASSNPGDLVADFFCGAGTAALVAARLGRRFLANDAAWRAIHTTRARLIASSAMPFSLNYVGGSPGNANSSSMSEDKGEFTGSNAMQRVTLSRDGKTATITLDDVLASSLDYWEVDPAWDGLLFRSAAQAIRPPRRGGLPVIISVPEHLLGQQLCIRWVQIDGKQEQIVINLTAG